jgi:predicted DNA binding CopG/RHH family protein
MTKRKGPLEQTLEKAGKNELKVSLSRKEPKNKLLTLRVSAEEHEAIKAAARSYGLTVTEYLLRLHRFAIGREL